MNTYLFASSADGAKFEAQGATLQAAFKSLRFPAEAYAEDEDEAEELRGKRLDVWGWDETGERCDWIAYFE